MREKRITQSTLAHIVALRIEHDAQRRRLAKLDDELATYEHKTITAIDAGAQTEHGPLRAAIHEMKRVCPSYKSAIEQRWGQSAVDEIIAATLPTLVRRLIVS